MDIASINITARLLTGTDTNSYTAANLLLAVNNSYERITGKILAETAGGKWPYGDKNYTAFPTYTFNLTNGTAAYDIDALLGTGTYPDSTEPIMIIGMEIQDQNGRYYPINPITLQEIREMGFSQSQFMPTSGKPIYYEKRENFVVLYPAPDNGISVTLSAGGRIFYLRTADRFTSAEVTTGTKEPGFPSPWHDILAYEAAYLFAVAKGLSNINFLKGEVDRKERELMQFISRRNQDERPIMSMKSETFI